MARFRPPRDVPDLGLKPDQQARFNAWLRTAFVEIAEDLATLSRVDAGAQVAQETIDVAEGSLRRVTPPVGGMAVRVPPPNPANAGQTIRLMLEAPVGPLTVVARPGVGDDGKVFQPTINGLARATFTASGLVTLTSNGASDWKTSAEFAAEAAASTTPQAGLNAEHIVATAHPSLPNARVATDSTEIDLDYTTPGVVSWFLRTASVALSKLADLTGLSVLGRASASAGVMAAITASGARQALMSNAAGNAIGWRGIEAADVPAHTWAEVLATGASSGANDPHIDTGQFIGYGNAGSLPGSGQLRSSANWTANITGNATLQGSGNAFLIGSGGSARFGTISGAANIRTSATDRLTIETTGAWQLGGLVGTAGQVLTSGGAGTPPTWASVDLSSVTYTAGDGLDLAANVFSADVSDFAGAGLEDDGSNNLRTSAVTGAIARAAGSTTSRFAGILVNGVQQTARQFLDHIDTATINWIAADDSSGDTWELRAHVDADGLAGAGLEDDGANKLRIAAAAAGAGLTGGSGLALAVGAGIGIDVNADDVAVDVTALAGAGLENSSNQFRIAVAAAGNGLIGGGGSALAVGQGTGITVSADAVGVNTGAAFAWTGNHSFTSTTFDVTTTSGVDFNVDSSFHIVADTFALTTTVSDIDLASQGDVDISPAGAFEVRSGTNILLQHNGSEEVVAQSDDGSGSSVHIEAAADGPAVAGGFGAFWSRLDGSDTFPCFTDVDDVDAMLQFAEHRRASLTTQTNSTNNAIATTHTIPANTVRAGDTYRLTGCYRYARGATPTASQLRGFFSLDGGITVTTGNITTQTANGSSGTIRIEALITFLDAASASTPYTASVLLVDTIASATVVTRLPTPSITATVNATADFSLSIRAQFTTAVPDLSVTALQGCTERIG